MKNIIIFCRQEGVSGMGYVGNCNTELSARLMAEEINSVAALIVSYGYEAILCNAHAYGFVASSLFYKTYLSEDVKEITTAELNAYTENCSGVMLVGMTAKAGTANAFMAGTWNHLGWHDYYINGKPIGEIGIYKTYFDYKNIPVIFVSGDRAACTEALMLIKSVAVSETKTARFRNVADCYDKIDVLLKTKAAVKLALDNIGTARADELTLPLTVRIDYNRTDFCDDAYVQSNYSLTRLGARTLEKKIEKIERLNDLVF